MKKKMASAWIICFGLLLLLPGAVWSVTKEHFQTEASEKEVSTELPKLTKENYQEYAAAAENAFNASVPFRSQLITLSSLADVKLFQEKSINDKVVLGDENWLFYSMESNIQDYKGTNLFTGDELVQIASQLTVSAEWLESRGSEFVLFIAPNKETVYGEDHLPAYYKKGEMTRAQQLVSYLRENTDIRVVYPEEEMKAHKDEQALYWHYDTHWNAAGGYIGARELLSELGIGIPPLEDMTLAQDSFSGYDLARMMNLQSYYEKKMPAEENYVVTGYPYNNLQAVSIDDATALVYHSDAPDRRRLFMVRDSFGAGMAGPVAASFADTYMAHWNGFFEQSMVEEQKPDIFVLELVERRLDYLFTFCLSD